MITYQKVYGVLLSVLDWMEQKKVGDLTAVSNYYYVSAGDVQISHDHKNQQDAIKQALESCEEYKKLVETSITAG